MYVYILMNIYVNIFYCCSIAFAHKRVLDYHIERTK